MKNLFVKILVSIIFEICEKNEFVAKINILHSYYL
jgi:hypothetical protein